MNRDRNYYREMREKHIKRKKRIAQLYYGWEYYQVDGKYSKNKIHCSCQLCRGKDYRGRHIQTNQEHRSEADMKEQIENI